MTIIEQLKAHPFTLALSAGYFGFFSHLGLLKILEEENLTPQRIVAARSGAIAGGLWATGATCEEMKKLFLNVKKSDFWDPAFGLGINKGQKFEQMVHNFLPQKFSETRIPFSVAVVEVPQFKTREIDKGLMAPAIRASASLPWLFHPKKQRNRYFIDGAVFNKTGLVHRRKNERVFFHYLLSGSLWGVIERWRDRHVRHSQDILVYGESNITVGPERMHLGEKEYERSYRRMRQLLYEEAPQGAD